MHICFYSFRSSRPKYKTHYICKTTEKWCFYSMFSKEKRCKKTVFYLSDVVFSNVAKKGSDVLECCRLIRAVMTSFVTSKPLKCPATFWNIRAVFMALIKSLQQLYISSTFHLLQERLHRATEQTQSCGQEEQQLRQHQPGSNQTEEEALRTI